MRDPANKIDQAYECVWDWTTQEAWTRSEELLFPDQTWRTFWGITEGIEDTILFSILTDDELADFCWGAMRRTSITPMRPKMQGTTIRRIV